ncbi:hypothetical protein PQ478_09190 [Alkalihalophilus pseudofirmus]|uniref:hypothetical protein n=1 Tax=Alkalihalophilus pseudofirmus TaxID=79885 RepID=UPI00259B13CA|nr:hypothetical protein [Alkalihalophilus pseudofirmus]WEG18643.1 hypothetical protein PQ478_09190 [Alkalihalophilus pseudofirmus]
MNKLITIIFVLIIATTIGFSIAGYFNTTTYTITVTEKEVKKSGNSHKYLVFAEIDSGETKVFENVDSLFRFKFDSSDIQGSLREGDSFTIHTQGFRIPILSMYENIYKVEAAK